MNKYFIYLLLSLFFISCGKEKEEGISYHKGELTIAVDPSLLEVVDALSYRYMKIYENADIKIDTVKERVGLKGLLDRKYSTIVMSRPLTPTEVQSYKAEVGVDPIKGYFAAGAVIFVVPKDSQLKEISYKDIRKKLVDSSYSFLTNGANSGNTDFMAYKLDLPTTEMKIRPFKSDKEVIENLPKYKNAIGIIGLNTISRPYGSDAIALRDKIRILPVKKDSIALAPTKVNLKENTYPFTKIIYFLTTESGYGIAHGLMRYAANQAGQLIVQHNGLQMYYLYERRVRIVPNN